MCQHSRIEVQYSQDFDLVFMCTDCDMVLRVEPAIARNVEKHMTDCCMRWFDRGLKLDDMFYDEGEGEGEGELPSQTFSLFRQLFDY